MKLAIQKVILAIKLIPMQDSVSPKYSHCDIRPRERGINAKKEPFCGTI